MKNIHKINENIYITSDEEIKDGDWIIYKDKIIRANRSKCYSIWISFIKNGKKIILTTYKYLIKDGVQKIDDEFLEWFVKNPSCERVEVELKIEQLVKPYDVYFESVSYYKINIPKEEAKQCNNCNQQISKYGCACGVEPKQETILEEVLGSTYCAYSVIENKLAILYRNQVKIHNAVTQQQRMYSEEEVLDILFKFRRENPITIERWFKQFKNK